MRKTLTLAVIVLGLTITGSAVAAQAYMQPQNPRAPFPPNKSAEASIAIDKHMPNVVGAGGFDEVDEAPCGTAEATPEAPCPFVSGVGTSGVYFSWDRGHHWFQPSFTGWTARNGTPHYGTIHTLPWYYENGLVSDADSAVAFGPRPVNGQFSWANGSRFYYANLTSNVPPTGARASDEEEAPERAIDRGREMLKGGTLNGYEAIAVSRIDNPTSPARVSNKNNWSPPVVIPSHISATAFEDKEQIWADNASSSPYFGRVYTCFAEYRSNGLHLPGNFPVPLKIATSLDGGDTWRVKQVTPAGTSGRGPNEFGISGCTIRTDSHGVVYVMAEMFQNPNLSGLPTHGAHILFQSFDGGITWTKPRTLFRVTDPCWRIDPAQDRCVEDGVAGARTDLAGSPSMDIANGAPTGAGATNEIVDSWVDARMGLNREKVMLAYSMNGAQTWSNPQIVPGPGRGFYSAPAITPNGRQVYIANSWFLTPFQETTSAPRWLTNTFQRATVGGNGAPGGWSTIDSTPPGDARGGSANALDSEFLGDYNYASAVNGYGIGTWTADARNAEHCTAIDMWRMDVVNGTAGNPPNPATACPGRFGNIELWTSTSG